MECKAKTIRQTEFPAEAIGVLIEISRVSRRMAENLARLKIAKRGGYVYEQDERTGCRCCGAAQMR